jgi:hypothetical protein
MFERQAILIQPFRNRPIFEEKLFAFCRYYAFGAAQRQRQRAG